MTRILTVSAALLALAACGTETGPDAVMDSFEMGEGNVEGQLRGDMPVTGEFDAPLTTGYTWRNGPMLEFDLHSTGGHGWAMLGGGFERLNLEDGESTILEPDEHWIFGCSGPGEFEAEYDEPAEEVAVSKEIVEIDGQAMVQLTVTAEFANGSEATAVMVRPAGGGDNNDDG